MFNIKTLLVVILTVVLTISINSYFKVSESIEKTVTTTHTEVDVSSAFEITCTYPQVLHASYFEQLVSHVLPKQEKNPLIFTFSDLDSPTVSKLSFIDSTRTITTVPLVKLTDDQEKYIFIDGTGENYLSTHTLYKKEGVSTYTKTVGLFGMPSGTLAMGTCIGY